MGGKKQGYVPYEHTFLQVRCTDPAGPFSLEGISSADRLEAEPISFKDAEDLKKRVSETGRKLFYVCCKHRKRVRFTWVSDAWGELVYAKSANAVRDRMYGDMYGIGHGSGPGRQISCLLNIQELESGDLAEILNLAARSEYGELFRKDGTPIARKKDSKEL